MALPLTRNTTYTPASPVYSNDLNFIQDCIVGDKHGTVEWMHGGPAFTLVPGGNAALANGQWTFGAVSTLVSHLRGGVGTRITSVRFGYNRGGAGNITLKLRMRNVATGAPATDVVSQVINAGTGYTTITLDNTTPGSLLPLTSVGDESWWLEVTCDNAAHVFGGAGVFGYRP